nr:unnamed protein product [Callosobruchus analis]
MYDEKALEEDELDRTIQRLLIRAKDLEDLQGLLDLEWPRTVFEKLHEETGDVLASPWKYDLANFSTCDLEMSNGISRRFKERYGGLAQLKAQNTNIGGVVYLINTITVPSSAGIEKQKRYIWHLMVEKKPQVLMDAEAFYKAACKLRNCMVTNGRHRLAILYISTYNWNHVEKILEFVFMDTDIEIRVYKYEKACTKRQKKALETENKYTDTRKKRPTRKAVIIKGDSKSYAVVVG